MARALRRKNPPARTSSDGGCFHPDFSDNSPITVLELLSARYDPDNSLAPGTPKRHKRVQKGAKFGHKKSPFRAFRADLLSAVIGVLFVKSWKTYRFLQIFAR